MDNEISAPVTEFFTSIDTPVQLVQPNMHRCNAAERAIRTFKNHFIAGLASTDKAFCLHLWDRLLPQAIITLNLLRRSWVNPNLSAFAQLYGHFNFNATPLAPPGTRVLVHEKPLQRRSWAPHGVDGWYVGPAMRHYRCYKCCVSATNSDRIADTVDFFPQHCAPPALSSKDTTVVAAHST